MMIDIHVHTRLFETPERGKAGAGRRATGEELIDMLKPQGVTAACLLPGVSPECAWFPQSTEAILAVVDEYPDFFIPFMNVDPRQGSNSPDADLGYLINHYKDRGCKAIGEVIANLRFDNPLMENLFEHAQDCELPLTFHLAPKQGGYYGIVDDPGLPGLEEALRKFPELRFLGHSQPFWAEISGDLDEAERNSYPKGEVVEGGAVVRLMREHANLYGDLSAGSGYNAISRDPEFGYKFLTEFQDKLLFGTDICDPRNETPIIDFLNDAVDHGDISREVYEKVAYKNAEALLGLESEG